MEFVEIVPDAIQAASGNPPAPVTAAGSDPLEDNTDATFLSFAALNSFIRVSFTDYTLPGNKRIWGAYIYVREGFSPTSGTPGDWTFFNFESRFGPVGVAAGTHLPGISGTFPAEGTFAQRSSPWALRDWLGNEWTDADVDATFAYFIKNGDTGNKVTVKLAKLRLVLALVTQPVAAITSPVGGASGVSKAPLIKWSYTGNGEAQNIFQVKVFTQAIAEGVGFDPAVSATVYDSGAQLGSATQWQIPAGALAAGTTYYVSVQVYKSMNFSGQSGLPAYASAWAASKKFTTNQAPVTVVTAPADPTTNSTTPTVIWTYSDPEGNPQTAYQVRVFTAAQYGIGGFDPAVSPATYDSGEVATADLSKVIPALANATYRAYVRTKDSDGNYSAWAFKQWVQNVVAPTAPYLAVAQVANTSDILITYNRAAAGPVPDFVKIERGETDLYGTVVWTPVRGGDYQAMDFSGAGGAGGVLKTITDREALPNVQVQYRVTVYDQLVGDVAASAPTVLPITLSVKKVWVKLPKLYSAQDSFNDNQSFPVEQVWLPLPKNKQRTVHRPLGRALPVVVRGLSQGKSGALSFLVQSKAKYDAIDRLLDRNVTLLILTPKSRMYVDVQALSEDEHLWDEVHGEVPLWRVSATILEVEMPA